MALSRPCESNAAAAWSAWRAAEFDQAFARAEAARDEGDDARHVLVLAAHALGRHEAAIAARAAMSENYPRLRELDETVLWSYAFAGDTAGGEGYAHRRGLTRGAYARAEIEVHGRRRMQVDARRHEVMAFSDDRLSAALPGLAGSVNGRATVFRVDTGGSWLHMDRAMAREFGVQPLACRGSTFAALMRTRECIGVADMTLGGAVLRNVPVSIVDELPALEPLAQMFGAPIGPLLGTRILAAFARVALDGPARQLVVDPSAAGEGPPSGAGAGAPFGILGTHFTVARAELDGRACPLFLDSGLAAFDGQGRQAAMLMAKGLAHRFDPAGAKQAFAALPALKLDRLASAAGAALAYVVADGKWREFGDWNGVEVAALLSWGFLGNGVWTIDYAARRMWLAPPQRG